MSENKKATVGAVARTNITQRKSYHKGDGQSSPNLKEFLGVLLLRLVAGHLEPDDWLLFERMLRRYYAIERAGGAL
jgi:hypothetical protein